MLSLGGGLAGSADSSMAVGTSYMILDTGSENIRDLKMQTLGSLSTRRFSGDGDIYKRVSLGKSALSFPPKSKLKQRGIFATATLSKPASKA